MRDKGFHHVAYACRDAEVTRHFYEDLMGFPLIHTEGAAFDDSGRGSGFMRHLFFDCGGGESIAFFDVHNVGESEDWKSEISTGNGLPVWVNHCAFWANADQQETTKARMAAGGVKPLMEIDHGWCHSVYFLDPNGIMVELCRDTPGLPVDREAARRALTEVPSRTPKATH
ncbi:MAG: VOC family protein [Actinomycetota bacterium]